MKRQSEIQNVELVQKLCKPVESKPGSIDNWDSRGSQRQIKDVS